MKRTPFTQEPAAIWLKGNLHCHTTNSDGCLSPEAVTEAYRSHGYDFLAVTDHDFYTDTRALSTADFTLLQGFELFANASDGKQIHINFFWDHTPEGIAPGRRIALRERTGAATAAFCRAMRAQGAYVMLNHPHWSMLTSAEIEDENPYHAVEIYNYSSEWLENTGEGSVFWTEMLNRGVRLWGGGSDDNHNEAPLDSMYCDSFGGWTVVRAKDRTPEAILRALKSGSFYTSTGPEIYDFYVEDGFVHLSCSPCVRIYFAAEFHGFQRKCGRYVTEFTAPLSGKEKMIRAEVMDAAGHSAYTNPIWLADEN